MTEEFAAFQAGWAAAARLESHEWGPGPPRWPWAAFKLWKNTCGKGHYTFRIPPKDHKRIKCASCEKLLKRGEFK